MTGVLIRFDTPLDPVKKKRSFGGRTGFKPKELELKPRAAESPVKVCVSCICAGNKRTLLSHLHLMLKETGLIQSVSTQKPATVLSEVYSPRCTSQNIT